MTQEESEKKKWVYFWQPECHVKGCRRSSVGYYYPVDGWRQYLCWPCYIKEKRKLEGK